LSDCQTTRERKPIESNVYIAAIPSEEEPDLKKKPNHRQKKESNSTKNTCSNSLPDKLSLLNEQKTRLGLNN